MQVVKLVGGALALLGIVAGIGAAVLQSDILSISLEELEARYATEDSRFAEVDGVRLHYMDQGSGPAVLLLHASFMNLRTWDSLASELSQDFRVIRPDLLNAGLTGWEPNDEYTFDRNRALVLGLLDQLGVDTFAVVATSSGGIVGFNLAAAESERVTRLVLINSAGLPRDRSTDPNRNRRAASIANWISARYNTKSMVRGLLDLNFIEPNEPPDWLVDMQYDFWRKAGRREAGARQMAAFRTGDPQQVLGQITAPTLILWGLNNATVMHLQADVFQNWLVNAPTLLKKYPGVGHYLYIEDPQPVEADIHAFLRGDLDGQLRLRKPEPYLASGSAPD
ncbi:MAG: alpha/beta hydrolase [Gammaproteobacteria bacterium]|jgi:pimeloyl-ACP methyl ester carboxylesterase|nr:alpha/beta hydrolase [Gammaproteobacteria bacterium]